MSQDKKQKVLMKSKNASPASSKNQRDPQEKVLMKIEGAPSRYMTWVDYSIRMKQATVSVEDYERFYRKYYGFVIGHCRRKYQLDDWQTSDIIDRVFDKFIKTGRMGFNSSKGHFHVWFAKMIDNVIKDYFRENARREKVFKDEDGKHSCVDVEAIGEEDENKIGSADTPDGQSLWNGYMAFLAWETVAEKSPAQQIQCFLWRHNNDKEPAEIAAALGISSLQVSEHIRSFKNKLITAMRNLDETYDPDHTDWKEIKHMADAAKKKYLAIAEEFPIVVAEN